MRTERTARQTSQDTSHLSRFVAARRRPALVAALAAAALVWSGLQPLRASATLGTPTTRVILTSTGGSDGSGIAQNMGGRVVSDLPLINGVVVDVPNVALGALSAAPGLIMTPDVPVTIAGMPTDSQPRPPAAVFPAATGAARLAANGVTGHGVGVAVLDTGIASLPDFAGRLIDGVDLSGEGNPFLDSYGHGTFVAGLIAGDGTSSGGQYAGEAPGADLISVKVAGSSGTIDMATVIAGVSWVVNHRVSDHIGVLNMSLGSMPTKSTWLNPLDLAVEAAWRNGVAVVTSAGNAGPFNGTILTPGDDPLVITVGALDDQGTVPAGDDTMTTFSSVGPTHDGGFKPDLVASGRSVVSLRVPGSTVDRTYPSARIGAANFVGSGTSFSAAITSGAAALVLQDGAVAGQPDALKARLLGSATDGPVGNPFVDGHGALNAYWAAMAKNVSLNQPGSAQPVPTQGTLSLATSWNGSSWNGSSWNGSSWNGSSWNGSTWNGSSWNGSTWNGSTWNGSSWNGSSWNGSTWNGSTWNGSSWNGSSWNGSSWNGSSWNGSTWNGSSWNGSSWN